MPILEKHDYKPAFPLRSGHLNTIFPELFRKPLVMDYQRERIETPDNDFLDIDFLQGGHKRSALLCHGLEGSSMSQYMRGMANLFFENDWDVAAMNYRGCSGVMNRQKRMYHSGETEDLQTTLEYLFQRYEDITIIGFSLGANIVLKFAGEQRGDLGKAIRSVIAVSAPVDLKGSSDRIIQMDNYLYEKRFLLKLKEKVKLKHRDYPEAFPLDKLEKVHSIRDFDELYTSRLYGFKNAEEYYEKSSSRQFLPAIEVPTLIINSLDDPMLSKSCYPYEEARNNDHLHLLITRYGGHIGFTRYREKYYWAEEKALEFAEKYSRSPGDPGQSSS